MRVLIIGGVAGGATAAARLRRNSEGVEILVFERGSYVSYANCGLPYYIGGAITDREKLFVQTAGNFKKAFNIDVRPDTEVVAINRAAKTVRARDLATNREYTESYDKLVLSPGAEPVRPPIPGIDDPAIFTLRSVPDTDRIKAFIDKEGPRRAVVVGAGFIGLEMAENLHNLGIGVTVVETAKQVMMPLDFEMATEIHHHLKSKQVWLHLGDGVASFERREGRLTVVLQSGWRVLSDLVILSIGVKPDTSIARNAELELGKTAGIKVDEYMRTSDPDIYAVGDAVEFTNPFTGKPVITYLAGPANKQARIAADNIVYGNRSTYKGAVGTAIAKVFDLTVAATGVNERTLVAEGIPAQAVITHSSSHAGYYPGSRGLSIKTLFDPVSGRLLGAQVVGFDGVDKRIDVLASVIRRGGTILELTEFEHAYAPPYSSAKDPVNINAFVAENILNGRSRHLQWHEFAARKDSGAFVIDARSPEEYALGHVDGAVNIPHYEVRARLAEIPRDRPIVIYCGVGLRAYLAERVLRNSGYTDVANLSGGYKTFNSATRRQDNPVLDGDYNEDGTPVTIPHPNPAPTTNPSAAPAAQQGKPVLDLDATGLQCPGPILRLKQEIDRIASGDRIREVATDPGFGRDVEAWCRLTGNRLVSVSEEGGRYTALVEKADAAAPTGVGNGASLVLFSDDMDRALAGFVIANGAASAGKSVTMFFTFWGLSIIKRKKPGRIKKDLMGRMFGMMLPKNSTRLSLSKMNFGGFGPLLMRSRMKQQRVDSLESMIAGARALGVRMVACQMSMGVMGVKKEELIDGVELGGVASYLESASSGVVNLFI